MECKNCGYEPTLREIGTGSGCPQCGMTMDDPAQAANGASLRPKRRRLGRYALILLALMAFIVAGAYGYVRYQTESYVDAIQKQTNKANSLLRQTIQNPDKISNAEYLTKSSSIKAQLEDIRLELYSIDDKFKPELKTLAIEYVTKMRSAVSAIDDYVRAEVDLNIRTEALTNLIPKDKSDSYQEILNLDLDIVNKLTAQQIAVINKTQDWREKLEALKGARESAAVADLIVKYKAAEASLNSSEAAKRQAGRNLQQVLNDLSALGTAADNSAGRVMGIGTLHLEENP